MIRQMTISNVFQMTMDIWGCIICIFILILGRVYQSYRNAGGKILEKGLILNFFLLLSDALAYFFRGNTTILGWTMTRACNLLSFVLVSYLEVLIIKYLEVTLKAENNREFHRIRCISVILFGLDFFLTILSQFNGFYYTFDSTNHYMRSSGLWVHMVILSAGIILILSITVRYYKMITGVNRFILYLCIIAPLIALGMQTAFYGISLLNLGTTLDLSLLFFSHEMSSFQKRAEEMERLSQIAVEYANKKVELSENRTRLLVSQIQPHFLYNSLLVIRRLIETRNEDAVDSLDHFIGFLRGSVDMLEEEGLVLADQELEFVRNYLYLEQKRFGEKLQVVYQIEETGFMLPPLTVQPIVENAVRHGIRKKETGKGTVWIRFYREENGYAVEIRDDGNGIVQKTENDDGRKHVGISNVRERISRLCDGELEINSVSGEGTCVILRFPDR